MQLMKIILIDTKSYFIKVLFMIMLVSSFQTNVFAQKLTFTSSNLPIVIIDTKNQEIKDSAKIIATMKIIDFSPAKRNNLTDFANVYDGFIGIELHGNSSLFLPQSSFGIETSDSIGNSLNVSLLGMPVENDWLLIQQYSDKSFVRNLLSYDLFRQMGHYSARFRHCEVIVNGSYAGIYLFGEKVKQDKNRVNIAKLDPTENSFPDITGGYITKLDHHEWWHPNFFWWVNQKHPSKDWDVHMHYHIPNGIKISTNQRTYIQNYYDDFQYVLDSNIFADTTYGFRRYVDTKSWIDYLIVNEISRNFDGFRKSRYLCKEKDNVATGALGKLYAGPVWDFDYGFRDLKHDECDQYTREDGSGWAFRHSSDSCGWQYFPHSPNWDSRMLQDTNYANELKCRWIYLRSNIITIESMFKFIDSINVATEEARVRHFERYPYSTISTVDAHPSADFNAEIDSIKAWLTRRLLWLDDNMPGNAVYCANYSGVKDIQNDISLVAIYPNPFQESITLKLSTEFESLVNFTVFDVRGSIIKQLNFVDVINNREIKMELKELSQGIYFVQINDGKRNVILKIVR